jgi:hypothetical protein
LCRFLTVWATSVAEGVTAAAQTGATLEVSAIWARSVVDCATVGAQSVNLAADVARSVFKSMGDSVRRGRWRRIAGAYVQISDRVSGRRVRTTSR